MASWSELYATEEVRKLIDSRKLSLRTLRLLSLIPEYGMSGLINLAAFNEMPEGADIDDYLARFDENLSESILDFADEELAKMED